MENIAEVVCNGCGEPKPASEFRPQGRRCRACRTAARLAWRKKHPNKDREAVRRWHSENRERVAETNARWREENREVLRARGNAAFDERASITKTCSKCGIAKPGTEFYRWCYGTDGLRSHCKACVDPQIAAAKSKDPAKYAEMRWKIELKNKYGISIEEYDRMYDSQSGRCAICGDSMLRKGGGNQRCAHVDHCHATNRVRGLLCFRCNIGLGSFRDRCDLLRSATDYLTRSLDLRD